MIKTDLIIIGAGPTGLFTVFEAGLLGMKCHLVDSLTKPGGQCVEIYPNKPIYDIPAHPEILAGKLVDNLLDQIKPFSPNFSLGEIAEELDKKDDHFVLKTNKRTEIQGKVIVIAGGLGNFEPRKPSIEGLYKSMGLIKRNPITPQFTDHCFSGDYPTELTDKEEGILSSQLSLLSDN